MTSLHDTRGPRAGRTLATLLSQSAGAEVADVADLTARIALAEGKDAARIVDESGFAALLTQPWSFGQRIEAPAFAWDTFKEGLAVPYVWLRRGTTPCVWQSEAGTQVVGDLLAWWRVPDRPARKLFYVAGSQAWVAGSERVAPTITPTHAETVALQSSLSLLHAVTARASATALRVAQTLSGHPRLVEVRYPLLRASNAFAEVAVGCENGGTAIVLVFRDQASAASFSRSVELMPVAAVIAGPASQIELLHGKDCAACVVLHVGLEDPDELSADALRALAQIG